MSGFLLDTNIISELMKPRPNQRVTKWIESTPESLLYLSALTIGEVRKGIDMLGDSDPRRVEHTQSTGIPTFNPWNS